MKFRNRPVYTDEALSRILGEHAAGTLVQTGAANWERHDYDNNFKKCYPRCCVNQAAFNEESNGKALGMFPEPGIWFDRHYNHYMAPEELLEGLQVAK